LSKKRLLIVMGAGASLDFGLPSVASVAEILSVFAQERYPLLREPGTNLYKYLQQTVAVYWRELLGGREVRTPNFEEVLYAIFALAAVFPGGTYLSPLGAFVRLNGLPDVSWFGNVSRAVDLHFIRQFGHDLVDAMLEDFRWRCRELGSTKSAELEKFRNFLFALSDEFEISVVTLNYDDVAWRLLPSLETGFNKNGTFIDERVMFRKSWPCLLHLHGSVHFDMRDDYTGFAGFGGLHEIHWQEDLHQQFNQNASGRSSLGTQEGPDFPTSVLVAGYGKTTQIQRRPFRTYYSELERLVAECDTAMFLGYGFGDIHLNMAFERFRNDRRRPVVVIAFAHDAAMNAQGIEWAVGRQTVTSVLGLFNTHKTSMSSLGYKIPRTVAKLREAQEFEISDDNDTPLAIWYNGLLAACENVEKVLARLRSVHGLHNAH
jgi:hypothetical protein